MVKSERNKTFSTGALSSINGAARLINEASPTPTSLERATKTWKLVNASENTSVLKCAKTKTELKKAYLFICFVKQYRKASR